jgi:hypothetical protein
MFTFWNYYILKLLSLETIMFSDAMLSDINIVLCYILSQYRFSYQLLLIPTKVIQVSISAQYKWYKYSLNIAPKDSESIWGSAAKPSLGV